MIFQGEVTTSQTLKLGTIRDAKVHIIALLKKVAAEIGEEEAVEAAQEEPAQKKSPPPFFLSLLSPEIFFQIRSIAAAVRFFAFGSW